VIPERAAPLLASETRPARIVHDLAIRSAEALVAEQADPASPDAMDIGSGVYLADTSAWDRSTAPGVRDQWLAAQGPRTAGHGRPGRTLVLARRR
jgi:hypothetical protein